MFYRLLYGETGKNDDVVQETVDFCIRPLLSYQPVHSF
jgi:hypothetical protein